MTANTWYHFAAVCDGATLKLYKRTGATGAPTLAAQTTLTGTSSNTTMSYAGLDQNGHPWGWTATGVGSIPTRSYRSLLAASTIRVGEALPLG